MTPRRAGPHDAAKLALVGAASFLETFANDHPGDDLTAFCATSHSVESWSAVLADPNAAAWIVEEAAGSPVAYAVLVPGTLPGTEADDAELKRIYVLSKWHNTGTGRALFEAAEAEARRRGAKRLALSVYTKNTRAIAFYERAGFAVIGRASFPGFGEEFWDYVMAKGL
ncbi:MAG: GNAT family N-acetyltransferase [Sphingomonadales bacterium]